MKVIKFLIIAGIVIFITAFVFSVVPLPVIFIVGGLAGFIAFNVYRGYRKATKSMK